MLKQLPSEDDLRLAFAHQLAWALKGRGVVSDTGLDRETNAALKQVALAYPRANPALIASAKAEFERQLDGTHAEQQRNALLET